MRFRFPFLLIFLFISTASLAESMDDLVKRNGLYYKKFSNVPFTGEIDEGLERGFIENGLMIGPWVGYWDNGQLWYQSSYNKNEELDGGWVLYYDSGQLWTKGEYRNGKQEGYWEVYYPSGDIIKEMSGTYKNDKKISD